MMNLNGTILTDNNRKLEIIESLCIKKNEMQPNGKITKSQIWWYKIKCLDCNYEYYSPRGKVISRKDKCSLCSGRVVVQGVNDLKTTNADTLKYLKNKEDSVLYSKGSNKKVLCNCPNCGYEKEIRICNLVKHGFYCDVCSDNISYPNKCFINILKQLNINFINEYSPEWIGKKRYDFYLKDYNIIIEMDGRQHLYECDFMIPLEEQKKIDKYKDFMALKNGIKLIRIDCAYSNIDYIKSNLFKSELNKILDFTKIDWKEVEKYASNSLMLKACELKNKNNEYTTKDISLILLVSQNTIWNWLKRGNELGLCHYNANEESSKNGKRKHFDFNKSINVYDINENFLFEAESIKDMATVSEEKLGVKISKVSISKCCNGHIKSCKGYIFKFKTL